MELFNTYNNSFCTFALGQTREDVLEKSKKSVLGKQSKLYFYAFNFDFATLAALAGLYTGITLYDSQEQKNMLNKTQYTLPLGKEFRINIRFLRNMQRADERLVAITGASRGDFGKTLQTATGTQLTLLPNRSYKVWQNQPFAFYIGKFTPNAIHYKSIINPAANIQHYTIIYDSLIYDTTLSQRLNTCTTKINAPAVDSSITELVPLAKTLINGENKEQLLAIKDGIMVTKKDLPTFKVIRQTTKEEDENFEKAYRGDIKPYYRDYRADIKQRYHYGTDILEETAIPRDEEIFTPKRWPLVGINTPRDEEVFTNNISVCQITNNVSRSNNVNEMLNDNAVTNMAKSDTRVNIKFHDKKELPNSNNKPNPPQNKNKNDMLNYNKNDDF